MKTNYRHLFLLMAIGSALSISLSAQTARNPTNDMNELSRRSTAREVQQRDNQQRESGAGQVKMLEGMSGTRRRSNNGGINVGRELDKQFERTAELLSPPASYYHQHKAYLKDDKHELARLQPEMNCMNGRIISAQDAERCADTVPVQGNGSYYSFISQFNYLSVEEMWKIYRGRAPFMFQDDKEKPVFAALSKNKRDPINSWWNIHFANNRFEVGRDGVQGVVADLGRRDLNEVTLKLPELKFLVDYQPGKTFEDTQTKIDFLAKGVTANNLFYSNSALVQADHTYILRSIHYPYKPDRLTEEQNSYTSRGTDITVAFQVVGKENDGSIIILWKELRREKLTQKYKM